MRQRRLFDPADRLGLQSIQPLTAGSESSESDWAMDSEVKFSPPYNIPWATFLSTVERIVADPPNRVDRSFLGSQAGNIQTYLIAAFRGFGLISEELRPTQAMLDLADEGARKQRVAALLRAFYPGIVELGETRSTQGELEQKFAEAFPSITGESRVKAIRFFLGAAAYAEVPTSGLWTTPRAPRGSSGRRSGSRSAGRAGSGGSNGGGSPAAQKQPDSTAEMKQAYFALLLKKADTSDGVDDGLLDRIEKLVGLPPGGPATGGGDGNLSGSTPPTPPVTA